MTAYRDGVPSSPGRYAVMLQAKTKYDGCNSCAIVVQIMGLSGGEEIMTLALSVLIQYRL